MLIGILGMLGFGIIGLQAQQGEDIIGMCLDEGFPDE